MNSPNQLSFLPDDYLDLKAQRRTNAICASLFALVVIGAGAAFHITEKSMKSIEHDYADITRRYAEAAAPIERFKKMQDQQKRMEAHAALSASLLEKVPRAYLLAEITNALPVNVSLLDFTLDARPRNAAAKPQFLARCHLRLTVWQMELQGHHLQTLPEKVLVETLTHCQRSTQLDPEWYKVRFFGVCFSLFLV